MKTPREYRLLGGRRKKQQRLPELKSQKRVKNFIFIPDPENMHHIDLKRSQRQQMSQPNTGKKKVPGPNYVKKAPAKEGVQLKIKT